jgi:hypothetical protein
VEQQIARSSSLDRAGVGVSGRGGCMAEERHYVEEEPALIVNRGICGRHARKRRVVLRVIVAIEFVSLVRKYPKMFGVVVKLFSESPNWQIPAPVRGRCLFFPGGQFISGPWGFVGIR